MVIKFPQTLQETRDAQLGFYNLAGFPNVVGAIDGTHVSLKGAPLGDDEYLFVNRKSFHSLNVQLICDSRYTLTNVVARWPGSTHDSRILRNSAICQRFENGEFQGLLVGDSGYRLESWLMTPVRNPQTDAEKRYNKAHRKTRVRIEQVNGQIKSKFALLGKAIPMRPDRACDIILACCVLFNISKALQEPNVDDTKFKEVVVEQPEHDQPNPVGAAVREQIINDYFS